MFSSFQELRCSRCEARPKSQSQRLRVCQRQLKLKKGNSERLRSFSGGEFSHENRFYRKHMKICEELSEHVFTFLEEPKIKKPLGNPLIPVPQQDALRLRSQGVNIESYRIIFSHSDSYINTHRRWHQEHSPRQHELMNLLRRELSCRFTPSIPGALLLL